ncbi:MAG TPA: haloacid dehalogenase [Bacteroidales bacterium]|mgnify:CR=1 FL=1|nr:haloacid dehalogenase [Bacteroidales bacterium]
MDCRNLLKNLEPGKKFFVGIDSDGCVFDTMELKQKEFFIPNGIKFFNLFPVARYVRETWEFVNLYSVHRGVNRFPALVKVFELLEQRKEVTEIGIELPDMKPLIDWISEETRLGNQSLRLYCENKPHPFLDTVLKWSEAINADINKWLKGVKPFTFALEGIQKINDNADLIVVSQTPLEALKREWKEHNIEKFVTFIAGQEYGTKADHLEYAAKGKYPDDRILMIGDAPGDLNAAKKNNVLFYPVIPGKENESWKRLHNEAFDIFLSGKYKGDYENKLIDKFNEALPKVPPWKK